MPTKPAEAEGEEEAISIASQPEATLSISQSRVHAPTSLVYSPSRRELLVGGLGDIEAFEADTLLPVGSYGSN
jgi:hypothetical protein